MEDLQVFKQDKVKPIDHVLIKELSASEHEGRTQRMDERLMRNYDVTGVGINMAVDNSQITQ